MIYRQVLLASAIVTGLAAHSAEAQERWQGLYGGVGVTAYELRSSIPGSDLHRFDESGGSLALWGGYNYVRENGFVWGPEMQLSLMDASGSASNAAIGTTTFEGSYILNPRIRLGYGTDRVFLYGHLGFGISDAGIEGTQGDDYTLITPALGIGMEYATSELWALRIEASKYFFDVEDIDINGVDRDVDTSVEQLTVGFTRSF